MLFKLIYHFPLVFIIQVKRNVVKNPSQRSALGEIGNKNLEPVSVTDQDVKKLVSGIQKKAVVSAPVPEIQINDEVEHDVDMEEVEEEQEDDDSQFPEGVIDIDALEDQNNPQLCVEYAPSIYAYLRKVEEGLSIRKEFLKG